MRLKKTLEVQQRRPKRKYFPTREKLLSQNCRSPEPRRGVSNYPNLQSDAIQAPSACHPETVFGGEAVGSVGPKAAALLLTGAMSGGQGQGVDRTLSGVRLSGALSGDQGQGVDRAMSGGQGQPLQLGFRVTGRY